MLHVLPPPAGLSTWVDGAVVMRLGPAPGVSRFPALPQAMLTMRFARPAGEVEVAEAASVLLPPVTFHTLSTGPVSHAYGGHLSAIGLLVRPAAAACLLGEATGALVDQVLPWDTLAGAHEAERLHDDLAGARSDAARLQALAASLGRALAAAVRGRDPAYARLCATVGRHGVAAADALGVGARQLERRCRAVLGVSPKSFQRLARFHRALTWAVAGGPARLAEVALEAGYYDQSHLARDARELAGAPIGTLIASARPDSPWWPLAARIGR